MAKLRRPAAPAKKPKIKKHRIPPEHVALIIPAKVPGKAHEVAIVPQTWMEYLFGTEKK